MKKPWIIAGCIILFLCFACLCVAGLAGLYFYRNAPGSATVIQNTPVSSPVVIETKPQELKEVEVFSQSGTGRNSSNKFELTGGKITVHYKISNNSDCYNDSYFNQRPCYASFAYVQLKCDGGSLFSIPEQIISGVLGDGEKDLTFYDSEGTCYFDIQLNQGANWFFSVKEEKLVDVL